MLIRATFLLFLMCSPSLAQSELPACVTSFDQRTRMAMNCLHAEMTTCLAYYNIRKQCTPPGHDSGVTEKANSFAIEHLTKFAFMVGSGICMTNNAMLTRLEMSIKEQRNLTEDSCVNFDSLIRRHSERCKTVVENGDAILDECLKK